MVLRTACRRLAVSALLSALLVSGCTSSEPAQQGARSEPLRIVATFYPLAWMAQQIGGEQVVVTDLTPPGVEPHDLELAPDQVASLLDADVAFVLGRNFQPGPEKVAARRSKPTVIALDSLPTGPAGDRHDPHLWLDPVAFSSVRASVVAALSEADPLAAGEFAQRSAELGTLLAKLDGTFAAGLRTCDRRLIVTNHAAFGHLARRYGLKQESIAGVSPDAEPDAQRLADLSDLVKANGVTTVFTESLAPTQFAETLAREVGVKTATLNPLEGPTSAELARGENYLTIMRSNLSSLQAALGCRSS